MTDNSSDPNPQATSPRTWTDASSEAAFERLGDRFVVLARRYSRSVRRDRLRSELYTVGHRELTPAQVEALETIAEGEIRMSEFAARLGIEASTATRSVAPIVDHGLVDRIVDPSNRRFVILRCTPEGLEVAAELTRRRRATMRGLLSDMAPDRRLELADLLEEYLGLLERWPGPAATPPD